MTEPDNDRRGDDVRQREIEEHESLDAEQLAEDAADLFGAEDRSEPVGEAKAPPPPG